MPKFRVNYSYQQGTDHHSIDYMMPDAPLDTYNDFRIIETANREDAKRKLIADRPYATITSVEEIKE